MSSSFPAVSTPPSSLPLTWSAYAAWHWRPAAARRTRRYWRAASAIPAVMEIQRFPAGGHRRATLCCSMATRAACCFIPALRRLDAGAPGSRSSASWHQPAGAGRHTTATRDGIKVVLKANTELPLEVLVAQTERSGGDRPVPFRVAVPARMRAHRSDDAMISSRPTPCLPVRCPRTRWR